MRKVAVYAATRNIYKNMCTACKSLLMHNVLDRVYFLTEDDTFPEPLPDVIKCINVSDQAYFPPDGANYNSRWTYMTLMRLELPELLPDKDRVLWFDVDTIVQADISELFTVDLGDCYFGAAEEPGRSKRPFIYHNSGVMPIDLAALRDGKYKQLIKLVNGFKMDFPDQDAINLACQQQIKIISPTYNSCPWTAQPIDAKIIHFAADRQYNQRFLFTLYENQSWEAIKCQQK